MTTLEALGTTLVVGSGVFIVTYYLLINVGYLLIHVLALFQLRDSVRESEWNPSFRAFDSPFYPGVAMVVPAYNEAASIVESVRSMLALNYPDQEIVVVNDGSSDATLERLEEAFGLRPVNAEVPYDVPSEPIRGVYRSATHEDLLVVDKENGGKSDALNAGVWLTDQELFCAVDADTVIDRDALLDVVAPFLEEPSRTVASGGTIRVANECVVQDGQVKEVNLPKTGLAGVQVMEYLRAFYSGRLGLARLKGLILISGAFGVFRTDRVREIGGYRHDTITEDFDVVVRLHEHLSDNDVDYRIEFVPEPVAWTEVPETLRTLGRQRRRWYRGMMETVVASRRMFFRRAYGRVGTVVLPFFTAAEALGPLIEGFGYVLLPLGWYLGILNVEFFLLFLLLTVGAGVFLSWFGVFSEVWSYNRYESPWEVLRLLWYGVLENFGYRQWKTIVAWHGLIEYLRGDQSWGAMERRGFGDAGTDSAEAAGAAGPGVATAAATDSEAGPDDSASETGAAAAAADDGGFVWVDRLVDASDTDGFRWLAGVAADESTGRFVPSGELTAGAGDGGFVWTTDFSEGVGDGGFVWVTDPSLGAGDGGFVIALDDDESARLAATTDFSEGVGDGGFVWVTDPSLGPADGGFVWTRDPLDGAGDEGFVWVLDGGS
ncbi:glycosyltransferase [Halorubrum ezzemoulense]|uniref:Glycosyltransferase n=1 Tax=Halorubrum ezzemoulense TaxID=337243 RepID=A0ABT4YYU2_HALEZ|nr:glycosyltransferase [Halorubrum ezzemoulense]MDB2245677.1 glycosyltransferase [Halorubrum ezzemoulense]MDB2278945.1 glycosyltransferase [Halorubrum ezzemoulense]MDB2287633.1 glycosyltransferase [Halorubrum ezzemoulense]MDB2291080.1 glycosyltransferase [Halorubrum ezzemoulense]MDB2295579.1 glycosyltransferase [Halorubrum ezzemoulense]